MKRKFSTRIIAGIATSAVLAVGSLSFTAINAIADEAVSYYGLSADGTVISGTVTDYTKIASTDTAWGTAGKETWYVADGIVNIITTTYDYDKNKNVYTVRTFQNRDIYTGKEKSKKWQRITWTKKSSRRA